VGVITSVAVIGTVSLLSLGFAAPSLLTRVFMWITAVVVCTLAGVATWHGVELFVLVFRMRAMQLELFAYSPAETRGLRRLAHHLVTYAGVLTIGYAFALAATLLGSWRAAPSWVRTVQVFWPVLYVPFCFLLLLVPQAWLRDLVCERKEALLQRWEASMNSLLQRPSKLRRDDVDECNALADLFEKVSGTPEYVIDLSLALKTAGILIVNLTSLAVPREVITSWLRAIVVA
jgi:hypothetical protein